MVKKRIYISLYLAKKKLMKNIIVNRPSVAGAVLKSYPSLTDSFIHSFIEWSFSSESSRHCLSQTWRAGELKFWEIVHPPPCVTCHVSHVMCHMSCVTCHMWCVTCNVSHVACHMMELVGGGSVINGAYPI